MVPPATERKNSVDEFQQSAQQALANISPEERQQLTQELLSQAQQQGVQLPIAPEQMQDPSALAGALAQVHQQQPSALSGMMNSKLVKVALIAAGAYAIKKAL